MQSIRTGQKPKMQKNCTISSWQNIRFETDPLTFMFCFFQFLFNSLFLPFCCPFFFSPLCAQYPQIFDSILLSFGLFLSCSLSDRLLIFFYWFLNLFSVIQKLIFCQTAETFFVYTIFLSSLLAACLEIRLEEPSQPKPPQKPKLKTTTTLTFLLKMKKKSPRPRPHLSGFSPKVHPPQFWPSKRNRLPRKREK